MSRARAAEVELMGVSPRGEEKVGAVGLAWCEEGGEGVLGSATELAAMPRRDEEEDEGVEGSAWDVEARLYADARALPFAAALQLETKAGARGDRRAERGVWERLRAV